MARKRKGKKKRRGGGFRKGRKSRGGGRRRYGRSRRPRMGLIGKAGVGIAAVPVVWSAIEAIGPWTTPAWGPVPLVAKLKGSLAVFVNSMSVGYGLGQPIGDIAVTSGTGTTLPAGATAQTQLGSGAWLSTTVVGVSLVVYDAVTGLLYKAVHRSAPRTKIMGRQLLSG